MQIMLLGVHGNELHKAGALKQKWPDCKLVNIEFIYSVHQTAISAQKGFCDFKSSLFLICL